MEWNDFELFTDTHAKSTLPMVTIAANHIMHFNAAYVECLQKELQLENKQYVELMYSKSNNAIGITFSEICTATRSLKISRSTYGKRISISVTSFIKFYKIKHTGRYLIKKETIPPMGEVWVILLNWEGK